MYILLLPSGALASAQEDILFLISIHFSSLLFNFLTIFLGGGRGGDILDVFTTLLLGTNHRCDLCMDLIHRPYPIITYSRYLYQKRSTGIQVILEVMCFMAFLLENKSQMYSEYKLYSIFEHRYLYKKRTTKHTGGTKTYRKMAFPLEQITNIRVTQDLNMVFSIYLLD